MIYPTVSPWATFFRHSVAGKANVVFCDGHHICHACPKRQRAGAVQDASRRQGGSTLPAATCQRARSDSPRRCARSDAPYPSRQRLGQPPAAFRVHRAFPKRQRAAAVQDAGALKEQQPTPLPMPKSPTGLQDFKTVSRWQSGAGFLKVVPCSPNSNIGAILV
jgi:prepilin-type processing-associated H-X9-DG protein